MNEKDRKKEKYLNATGRNIEEAFDLAISAIIRLEEMLTTPTPGFERGADQDGTETRQH